MNISCNHSISHGKYWNVCRFVKANDINIIKSSEEFEIIYSCDKYVYHNKFQDPSPANDFLSIDIAVLSLKECVDLSTDHFGVISPCPADMDFREGWSPFLGLLELFTFCRPACSVIFQQNLEKSVGFRW